MRKICFVIYNRANYGRIKGLLYLLKNQKNISLKIVLASSSILKKYGSLNEILKKDGFKIDYKFYSHLEGENKYTMTKSSGLIILELSSIFEALKPDLVVTTGDRYETLATAICASYMNICLAHIQGGELTGSIDEKVRHSVTKLSDYHFVATKKAKKIVLQMGEREKTVFITGCPSVDIIKRTDLRKKIQLKKYNFGIGEKINFNEKYLVVLLHPDTTEENNNKKIVNETLNALKKIKHQIIWLWPNNDSGANVISNNLRKFRENTKIKNVNFYKNFEPEDYLRLINGCSCLVGNSSSGIRESSFLGIPVVNIGNRQSLREKGKNVIDVDLNKNEILKAVQKQIRKKKYRQENIYGSGNSEKKICNLLKKIKIRHKKTFKIF
tara:strand:- start:825 stop:1973 length:1149 start_codon:yes stop_codon:yes gene_type:complete